jgi:hypothetical protein
MSDYMYWSLFEIRTTYAMTTEENRKLLAFTARISVSCC